MLKAFGQIKNYKLVNFLMKYKLTKGKTKINIYTRFLFKLAVSF